LIAVLLAVHAQLAAAGVRAPGLLGWWFNGMKVWKERRFRGNIMGIQWEYRGNGYAMEDILYWNKRPTWWDVTSSCQVPRIKNRGGGIFRDSIGETTMKSGGGNLDHTYFTGPFVGGFYDC